MLIGHFVSVTLAGQGVIKNAPIFSKGKPVFFLASFFTKRAAVSMGEFSGSTCEQSSGNRTRIKRTTAGHAELMMGRSRCPCCINLRVASETSSALRATSYTSSNPIFLSPVRTMSMSSRLLNCPNKAGAGRAIL